MSWILFSPLLTQLLSKLREAPMVSGGHSVNRNWSVQFFDFLGILVTSKPGTDRFFAKIGTNKIQFPLFRFG